MREGPVTWSCLPDCPRREPSMQDPQFARWWAISDVAGLAIGAKPLGHPERQLLIRTAGLGCGGTLNGYANIYCTYF